MMFERVARKWLEECVRFVFVFCAGVMGGVVCVVLAGYSSI